MVGEQGTLGGRVFSFGSYPKAEVYGGILSLRFQLLGQLAGVCSQTVKGHESETSLHHFIESNKGRAESSIPLSAECEAIPPGGIQLSKGCTCLQWTAQSLLLVQWVLIACKDSWCHRNRDLIFSIFWENSY